MSVGVVTRTERILNVKKPSTAKKSAVQEYSEAFADRTKEMENQIKDGPPKYAIGASEYSIKEWNKLIKSVDKNIEFIKEEQKIRKEKQQKQDNLERAVMSSSKNKIQPSPVDKLNGVTGTPYSYLADEEGNIIYNGVLFVTDVGNNAICLGNMSDESNVLTIPLANGGSLKVNRNNIGDLGRAIGMFSPEDIRRIMEAVATDAHCQKKLHEMEDEENDALMQEEVSAADNEQQPKNNLLANATLEVSAAWEEALRRTGTDGFDFSGQEDIVYITQLQTAMLEKGADYNILSMDNESVLQFAEAAIRRLEDNMDWEPAKREMEFYSVFADRLRQLYLS